MDMLTILPTATVIGSGYVGVTTAAVLTNAGYRVFVLETNPERLEAIKAGRSFFYEKYIDTLLLHALESGLLIGAESYEEAITQSSIIFSCVGTPDNADGSSNLSFVYSAAMEAAKYIMPGTIYVQKSTVPVGTGANIESIFAATKKNVPYVSNPEFLREGSALIDSVWFDRVVVGSSNDDAVKKIQAIYKRIIMMQNNIAARAQIHASELPSALNVKYITTTRNSAELIKVSANAFLALKISFANTIAKLADATGADTTEVMDGIGADPRIGRAFLNAGRGYGGGCLPKDVSGLIDSGHKYGIELDIIQAASEVNSSMPEYIIKKASHYIDGGSFANKNVAILGAAFKAHTSDIRKSPAIEIAGIMARKMKARVSIYDPQALSELNNSPQLHDTVKVCENVMTALNQADVAIIATDWPEFVNIPPDTYAEALKGTLIVDAVNCLDPAAIRKAGLIYVGVGR